MSETPRKPSRFDTALEGFEANKQAANEQEYINTLRGEAGTADFSDEARQRLADLHAYDQYLEGFSADDRSSYDRGLDQLESGERESAALSLADEEHAEALGMNEAFDDKKTAESEELERAQDEALKEKFQDKNNPRLKHMNMLSLEIAKLRRKEVTPETADRDVERLRELEDKLAEQLDAYAESDDYDPAIADMLIDRGDTMARKRASENAYNKMHGITSYEEPAPALPEVPTPREATDDKPEVPAVAPEALTGHEREEDRTARIRRMGAAVRERMERDALPRITIGYREEKKSGRLDDEPSEDYLLADKENGIYGVFDGMGGGGGRPEVAAREAGKSIHESLLASGTPRTEEDLLQQMRTAFVEGRKAVEERGEGGSTVATAIRLVKLENGKMVAGIAQAGDTRAFSYSEKDGTYQELTQDQSSGNLVFNSFPGRESSDTPDEYKVIEVPEGTRLMICSDGITGDWEDQFLSDSEMTEAFMQGSPDESAAKFMELSKKRDDKTVVVIDVAAW